MTGCLRIIYLLFLISCFSSLQAQDWKSLYAELSNYYTNGTYQQGIVIGDQVLKQAEKEFGKAHENYANTLTTLGHLYNLTQNYKEAELKYEEAFNIYKNIYGDKHLYYAIASINLANVWKAIHKYEEAEVLYKKALAIYKINYGENSDYAGYSYYLGQLYDLMGKYDESEVIYKKAAEIYKDLSGATSEVYANSLFSVAQVYEKTVRYNDAENVYKQALEIYKAIHGENHIYYASVTNYLAHIYDLEGRYTEAEAAYKQALSICEKLLGTKHEYYASFLNNLGNLYKNIGRYKEAEDYYNRVAAIYKETLGDKHSHYATALNNLALLYVEYNDYEKAARYYKEAAEIYKAVHGEDHPYYAVAISNIGHMYLSSGDYEMAKEYYTKSCEFYKNSLGENHPDYAKALNSLGLAYKNLGNFIQAETLYKKSLAIQQEQLGEQHPDLAYSLVDLASLYEQTGRYKEAEEAYRKLNANLTYQLDNYFPAMSEREKESFYTTIKNYFEKFNSFAAVRFPSNPAIAGDMYNNQLVTKALLLNASNKIRDNILNSNDEQLIQLYKEWKYKKELLGKTFGMSKEEIAEKRLDVAALSTEANELEKKLSLKSQQFASMIKSKPSWKDVQAKLQVGEAAVEIIRFQKYSKGWTDSIYYAALVLKDKKAPALILLKNGSQLEKKHYAQYKNSIYRKIEDKNSYNQYWKPLETELIGINKVYFSPDGVYNMINLNSLKNPATAKYIIDEVNLVVISNTRDLIDMKQEKRLVAMSSSKAYFFGYPNYNESKISTDVNASNISGTRMSREVEDSLSRFFNGESIPELEGTKKEVTAISQMLQSNSIRCELYLRDEATEERVKNLDNPILLHIATHGFFLQDHEMNDTTERSFAGMQTSKISENPLLRSGLLLAGVKNIFSKEQNKNSDKEDGMLTAYEAMNLNLNNTLLVSLSACETGLGEIKNGEGVYGLQRAFQVAGARYILMSLWKVDDNATQELMVSFYQKWLATGNIHNSLKEAQKELKSKYKDPYYWAAFVLSGI